MCPPREGGPLAPPLPPLVPRRPLGGPLLLGGGGSPRLPLSNDGLVACSTLMAFPSKDFPFMSLAASFASAGLSKVTKAKPLDLLVSLSFIKSTSTIRPYLPNTASRAFSFVSVLSPPIKSFPGRSASTIFSTNGSLPRGLQWSQASRRSPAGPSKQRCTSDSYRFSDQ